jgi:hypothetical protein
LVPAGLSLPLGDLVRVNVNLRSHPGQRLLAFFGSQSHFALEAGVCSPYGLNFQRQLL